MSNDDNQILSVLSEIRSENRSEHKEIKEMQISQGKEIVCLQTKFRMVKWLIPISIGATVSLVKLVPFIVG